MNRVQRVVLVIYCLGLAYCCIWFPWCIKSSDRYGTDRQRLGYGWLWAGPQYRSSLVNPPKQPKRSAGTPDFSDVDEFVADQKQRQQWDAVSPYALPDMHLLLLRIVALSAMTGALFIIAGLVSSPLRLSSRPKV